MRWLFFVSIQCLFACGHGELDQKIREASDKIAKDPGNPELLLARAVLHQSHRDPKAAHADFLSATKCRPAHPPAFLQLARFQRKQGSRKAALATIQKYFSVLETEPSSPMAYRERALLAPKKVALEDWSRYLENKKTPTMTDFEEAGRAALAAKNSKIARSFLLDGLKNFPKSIPLHHLHCRLALMDKDSQAARNSFKTLELLYPSLLVKLRYEESVIWNDFDYPHLAKDAQKSALEAFEKLPLRFRKNSDLLEIYKTLRTSLAQ